MPNIEFEIISKNIGGWYCAAPADDAGGDIDDDAENDFILDLGDGDKLLSAEATDGDETKGKQAGEKIEKTEKTEKSETPIENKELDELRRKYQSLENHKKDLDRSIHSLRKENKELKGGSKKEERLTDDQIAGLIENHKDDPATLLNIIKYVSQQSAEEKKAETLNEQAISTKRKELDERLQTDFPSLSDQSSQDYLSVEKAKNDLFIKDHPLGDFLGTAAILYFNLPNLLKDAKEEGKNEAVGIKTEEKRKEKIKDGQPLKAGDDAGKDGVIPSNFQQTAKQMNMTKSQRKIYARLIANKEK